MGQIWDAFTKSYKTEGLTGARTPEGGKAYAFKTGYDIGSEIKISGFDLSYVSRRAGLTNQQTLVVLANLKFQRYFISSGSLDLYNTYPTQNARSRILGKRIKQWIEREGLKMSDIPKHASYQAANPADKDRSEVLRYGGSEKWIREQGGEAKDLDLPSLPSLPGFPNLSGAISAKTRALLTVIAIIGLLFLFLISLGYSGLGASVGEVGVSEYKRKRSEK